MSKQNELNEKEARLLVLQGEMQKSDAHAIKCAKLGINFQNEYPEEYAAYAAARDEYNVVESQVEALKAEIAAEEENSANAQQPEL